MALSTPARARWLLPAAAAALLLSTALSGSATARPAAPEPEFHAFGADARAISMPADDPARGLVHQGLAADKSGVCVGGFRVTAVLPVMCSHGPDAPPAQLSVKRSIAPTTALAAPAALAVCEGDGVSGRRVEVLYVHGDTSRYGQYLETFRTLAEGMDVIYNESARETGGERHIRFVTENVNGACRPVVRDVRVAQSSLGEFGASVNAVKAAGYNRTDRKYVMLTEANVYCGIGGFAGDTRKTDDNRSNFGPEYGRSDNGCWTSAVASHELGHNLGAVNNNAPNASGGAHCTDEYDVMCYSDDPYHPPMRYVCGNQSHEQRLDCNHDDYYSTNPASGSYLANNFNVADNLFLIRGGSSGARPIVNPVSGRCLDVSGGRTADGTKTQLWDCLNNPAQLWQRVGNTLVNPNSGKCLDVAGASTADGAEVRLWTCLNNSAQQWIFQANGNLVNPASGKCLDADAWGTVNGTRTILWACGAGPQSNQVWLWR
ncbi:RICIN domain-containing protein [Catellatospora sp. KI3]|uniref:RICIN domain-containing protein n=1 Tax=Catellatospora sp. KI3 TaxID=3041620 RepID=UPI00248211C2|nr:RICIN domain-containing protein [Catellatospora sp. KI3]MDI1463084.1 RICIN domain-containing protein [Catellatospora sp. KI3]